MKLILPDGTKRDEHVFAALHGRPISSVELDVGDFEHLLELAPDKLRAWLSHVWCRFEPECFDSARPAQFRGPRAKG